MNLVQGLKSQVPDPKSQVPNLSQVPSSDSWSPSPRCQACHRSILTSGTSHLTADTSQLQRLQPAEQRDCSKPVRARANQEAFPASQVQRRRWNPECTLSILASRHHKHAISDHTHHTSLIQPTRRKLQKARKVSASQEETPASQKKQWQPAEQKAKDGTQDAHWGSWL